MDKFITEFKNMLYHALADGIVEYYYAKNNKGIEWITVKGNHIPIKDGQTKEEAVKEFLKDKQNTQVEENGLLENLTKTIQDSIRDSQCNSKEPAEKFPKTIAGVERNLPMTFKHADEGNCNPSYDGITEAYCRNCQSCVVTYEARRRGYNVKAAPKQETDKTAELALHAAWAWIDPKTNKKCEYTATNTNNALEHKEYLEKTVKQGQRYQYSYQWHNTTDNKDYRHVLIVERDNFNDLIIFDPQRGKIYEGKEIEKFLDSKINPKILRIDDKLFNPYFMNDVMQKS